MTGPRARSGVALSILLLGQQVVPSIAERYDLSAPRARLPLDAALDEVSGLATAPDGRLFGHGDEAAVVFEIDVTSGRIARRFQLGERPVRGDFEGIAIAGDRFFLVTSGGTIYEFAEPGREGIASFLASDTGVGGRCEVEGLTYDGRDDALLLACKTIASRSPVARIHRLPLGSGRPPLSSIDVALAELERFGLDPRLHPSGIDVDPHTGTLVLVAAREEAIVEIDRSGQVLDAVRVAGRHPQPEGVAFGPDGSLIVGDEGGRRRPPRLTVYGLDGPGDVSRGGPGSVRDAPPRLLPER